MVDKWKTHDELTIEVPQKVVTIPNLELPSFREGDMQLEDVKEKRTSTT